MAGVVGVKVGGVVGIVGVADVPQAANMRDSTIKALAISQRSLLLILLPPFLFLEMKTRAWSIPRF